MSLRELRLKRGLTQKQLADKLGYTRERIAVFRQVGVSCLVMYFFRV